MDDVECYICYNFGHVATVAEAKFSHLIGRMCNNLDNQEEDKASDILVLLMVIITHATCLDIRQLITYLEHGVEEKVVECGDQT